MTDLWPEDINIPDLIAPVTILKEQASLLGTKTNNVVKAEVTTSKPRLSEEGKFYYVFYLVAPALNNYYYELFAITHGVELYPLVFNLDEDIRNEIAPEIKGCAASIIRIWAIGSRNLFP